MKKTILSVAAAAVMLLTGCGTSGNDSAKKETSLAAEMSDKLTNGDYDICFIIHGDPNFDGNIISIKRQGKDGLVSMYDGKVLSQFIKVNNETTMLLPEIQCFQNSDYPGAFGNAFIKLGPNDKLIETSEADGVITEVYESPDDSEGTSDKFTFDFDSDTKLLKHIKQETSTGVTEIEMDTVKWECDKIEMPDISKWDDISDGAMVQETTQLKFYLYYTMGIVESELNALGYTYDEIAHMKLEDRDAFYEELDKKAAEYEAAHKDQ